MEKYERRKGGGRKSKRETERRRDEFSRTKLWFVIMFIENLEFVNNGIVEECNIIIIK
jgi:hypothetical protein